MNVYSLKFLYGPKRKKDQCIPFYMQKLLKLTADHL